MEQDHAQEGVADTGLFHRRTAYQQGRDAEHADLGVSGVGGQVADVLEIDNHAETGADGRHDHGDDAGPVHVDARGLSHLHILAHGPHVLAQLRAAEPDDEQAQKAHQKEGEHGNLHARHADGQQVVQALAHVQQAHGIADAIAPGQHDAGMDDGDNRPHDIQHDELIPAVDKEVNDIAGDHLPALGHVLQGAADEAQQSGEGNGQDHGQHHAGNAPDLPVRHQNDGDLRAHGAQRHGEVQAHARHNGEQQAENQEQVPAHTGDDLIEQIAGREARHGDKNGADDDEHDGHGVVPHQLQKPLPGGDVLFPVHFTPSVFLVRAYRIMP